MIITSVVKRCAPIAMVCPVPRFPCCRSAPAPRRRGCRTSESYNQWTSFGRAARATPTGHPVQFPLCGIFTFDAGNKLAGENIYYDRATSLTGAVTGRIEAVVVHPLMMTQAIGRPGAA